MYLHDIIHSQSSCRCRVDNYKGDNFVYFLYLHKIYNLYLFIFVLIRYHTLAVVILMNVYLHDIIHSQSSCRCRVNNYKGDNFVYFLYLHKIYNLYLFIFVLIRYHTLAVVILMNVYLHDITHSQSSFR